MEVGNDLVTAGQWIISKINKKRRRDAITGV
jgi:hypothetical protein